MTVTAKPKAVDNAKCGVCDHHPTLLCPTCPRRLTQASRYRDPRMAEIGRHDRTLGNALMRTATAAAALAQTSESHPAYPALEREYVAAADALQGAKTT